MSRYGTDQSLAGYCRRTLARIDGGEPFWDALDGEVPEKYKPILLEHARSVAGCTLTFYEALHGEAGLTTLLRATLARGFRTTPFTVMHAANKARLDPMRAKRKRGTTG